ncbi:hypothetical protein ACJIZ3_020353 [Penstemon smallii]|uniref:S-adenosylmethionine-dependent methyltransferase n=1 Tax=Penstemon smallii TaxID=265156 RepID=A0ABD3SIH3_9LAMI
MQIITEAVEKKLFPAAADFQVFFNDQVINDFNTLFKSLPPERPYHAAGLPGSFHGRLLPKKSLHFAYSSCALHWLSETKDYANHDQFAKDIQSFLEARADEVVDGGLMALLVPAVPNNNFNNSESADYTYQTEMDLIVSCLMDMANKGRLFSQEKVDSFNFPLHFTNPQELKAIIERNQNFNIERMETLNNIPGKRTLTSVNARASFYRAAFEGLLINHFGSEIIFIDELFDLYSNKVLDASSRFLDPDNDKSIIIFVLLKRKVIH